MVHVKQLGDTHVYVHCQGQPLSEFNDESLENTNTLISRYIQCETDTEFEVVIEPRRQAIFLMEAVVARVYVDGKYIEGRILRRHQMGSRPQVVAGKPVSTTKILPFKFVPLKLIEGSGHQGVLKDAKEVGRITVQLAYVHLFHVVPQTFRSIEGTGAVSEKSLKGQAVSCTTQYGAPKHAATSHNAQVTKQVGPDVAVVNFHYRTRADLRAMHVIPRTPTPEPIEQRSVTELTADEVRRLQEEVRILRATHRTTEVKPVIKREREEGTEQSRKRSRPNEPKVVLILDDDDDTWHEETLPTTARVAVVRPA